MVKHYLTSLTMALACTFSLGLTACDDDEEEPAQPTLEISEANIEGDELCVQADIEAEGSVSSIVIAIRAENAQTDKVTYSVTDSKYIGVRNIDGFHVHVDIADKGVEVGDILSLTVIDKNGKSAIQQASITEEEEDEDDED